MKQRDKPPFRLDGYDMAALFENMAFELQKAAKRIRHQRIDEEPALPHPLDSPMGDRHHTDAPITEEDTRLANHLAYYLGTMLNGINSTPEAVWQWWHYERTSVMEWELVARALRIHGLKIVDRTDTKA